MSQRSVTFFTDEVGPSPANQTDRINKRLIEFIQKKSTDNGYDSVKALAKAFGYKNPDKVMRQLETFYETGELNPEYMKKLLEILHIDPEDIKRIKKEHQDRLYAPLNLFIHQFEALYAQRKKILNSPRYRNIVIPGIEITSAWVSRHRPLTLGELYFHWDHKEFIERACCGKVFVFRVSGSALSGANDFSGYCPACKKVYEGSLDSFHDLFHAYINHVPDFPYEYSDCTMQELVESLLGQTG